MTTPESVAPISNKMAEMLIIGRILVNPEVIKEMPKVLPEAITNNRIREIYRIALILQRQNAVPTVEAISAWLMAVDQFTDEMQATMQKCLKVACHITDEMQVACHNWAQSPPSHDVETAVRIVMTKYLRRIAASMGENLSEMAKDSPVEMLVRRATRQAQLLQELLPACIEQSTED